MSRRSKILLVSAVVFAFLYGFAAGSYRLPPFYQIAWIKNSIVERLNPPVAEYEPLTPRAVTILETALQRILVKRVPLPSAGDEFVGGGALTAAGNQLYVVTSGGHVSVYDTRQIARLSATIDTVPINRADLMRSKTRYIITTFWFRVSGAFAEVVDDSTQRLFVAHNRYDPTRDCFTYNISRTTLVRSAAAVRAREPWRTIYTTTPCMTLQGSEGFGRHPFSGHISGGKMLAFDRTRLLVTVGDFNYDGYLREAWSMDRSNPYGKFMLVDKESGRAEIHAIGARNDMGLYRDSAGTIWATESGPQGGDELNVVVGGANYGWPTATFGIGYESSPWPREGPQGRHDAHQAPVFAWLPSVVPTNLIRIEGPAGMFDAWRGDLLIGSLRDQALHRLRLDARGRVVYDERIPFGDRIRDLLRLPDGKIVLLTDATGFLTFLDDGGPEWERITDATRDRIAALERYDQLADPGAVRAELSDGESLFKQKCVSCHALDGREMQGPSLAGVLSRRVGSLEGFDYSTVLGTDTRTWDPELMIRFLLHSETDFVNTRMQKVSLTRAQADSIVAYLGRVAR
ncbi:MAG: PQQ-dependent sugar dehydrogenase [Gemmatimonadaceae bacterium]